MRCHKADHASALPRLVQPVKALLNSSKWIASYGRGVSGGTALRALRNGPG